MLTPDIVSRVIAHCNVCPSRKTLLVPPDITRAHSGGGALTALYYQTLTASGTHVDILPALGTHKPMTRAEQLAFFGDIPHSCFLIHNWRSGVTTIGEIPCHFVHKISMGMFDHVLPVQVSNYITDPSYDRIISIGQVVPHEVVGMANYTKNIVIGCGGSQFINASHALGAFFGIEQTLGQTNTPVRALFDYVQENFLHNLPLEYVLTVVSNNEIAGLYIGNTRDIYERAAIHSQQLNITYVDTPIQNCVVYLDESEFHSTWLGNKAVYRTRLAMANGGNLLVVAPAVRTFGEDAANDVLIRKYGYAGREKIIKLCKTQQDLAANLSAAAHLIHGSTDGRFTVTYAAPLLGRVAVEAVGYRYMEYDKATAILHGLIPGINVQTNKDITKTQKNANGNSIRGNNDYYYIPNPAIGLWKARNL